MQEHVLNPKALLTQSKDYGHRDIDKEYTSYECEVQGEIPEWIKGTIYKQTGGAFGDKHNNLDGLAHISAFKLENGKAFFSNKFMRTKEYVDFINTGERSWGGTNVFPEQKSVLERLSNVFQRKTGLGLRMPYSEVKYDNFNPNVTTWVLDDGNIVAAQTENGGIVCPYDSEDLTTLKQMTTMKPVSKSGYLISTPAHYFREGAAGGYHVVLEMDVKLRLGYPEFIFFYNVYKGDLPPFKIVHQEEVVRFKYNKLKEANKSFARRPSYMHTVARTENFLILINSSMKYDLEKILNRDFSGGIFNLFPLVDHPIEFWVYKVDVDGSLKLISRPKCDQVAMIWHIANAFEVLDDGKQKIIIEGGCSQLLYKEPNYYGRFILDLATETAIHLDILKENGRKVSAEFPSINPAYLFKPYRYTYIIKEPFSMESMALLKLENRRDTLRDVAEVKYELFGEPGVLPSEPCFVAAPFGEEEDEGVILTMITDAREEESFLAVIDAKTGVCLAKAFAPVAINIGLHSTYVPAGSLDKTVSKL